MESRNTGGNKTDREQEYKRRVRRQGEQEYRRRVRRQDRSEREMNYDI